MRGWAARQDPVSKTKAQLIIRSRTRLRQLQSEGNLDHHPANEDRTQPPETGFKHLVLGSLRQAALYECEASLGYIGNSRPAKATQHDAVSKHKKKINKKSPTPTRRQKPRGVPCACPSCLSMSALCPCELSALSVRSGTRLLCNAHFCLSLETS